MNPRSVALKEIRPILNHISEIEGIKAAESFQNSVLRPILKFQNELLIAIFQNYILKHKGVFYDLNVDKKLAYIDRAIQKDIKFRNALKGIVIGQFTLEEYNLYRMDSSSLNKRIMNLISERLKDQIQHLDLPLPPR